MKKILNIMMIGLAFVAASCQSKVMPVDIDVQLMLNSQPFAQEGITVSLTQNEVTFEATTDASGVARFTVAVGSYEAAASFKKAVDGKALNYNGTQTVLVMANTPAGYMLPLTMSEASQLIIKECYNGGCPDNAGTGSYLNDKYLIIYNNSDMEVDASKMCITMGPLAPTTSTANYLDSATGKHSYEADGWCPASYGVWWFQNGTKVVIPPYSQIVVAVTGAVDHTKTYEKSVDLSGADYCMYDPESGFNLAAAYPAPSATIPATNYMKTYCFGMGTSWPLPFQSATPFIILPDQDIQEFVKNTANFDNKGKNKSSNYCKIPQKWVCDALGIFVKGSEEKSTNVFPTNIDAASISFEGKKGYSLYRNVDKEATEAIAGNEGKLVYDYKGEAYEGMSDPSGIDAEASIKKGAKIVYKDTNNSKNDFHVRKVASIKK